MNYYIHRCIPVLLAGMLTLNTVGTLQSAPEILSPRLSITAPAVKNAATVSPQDRPLYRVRTVSPTMRTLLALTLSVALGMNPLSLNSILPPDLFEPPAVQTELSGEYIPSQRSAQQAAQYFITHGPVDHVIELPDGIHVGRYTAPSKISLFFNIFTALAAGDEQLAGTGVPPTEALQRLERMLNALTDFFNRRPEYQWFLPWLSIDADNTFHDPSQGIPFIDNAELTHALADTVSRLRDIPAAEHVVSSALQILERQQYRLFFDQSAGKFFGEMHVLPDGSYRGGYHTNDLAEDVMGILWSILREKDPAIQAHMIDAWNAIPVELLTPEKTPSVSDQLPQISFNWQTLPQGPAPHQLWWLLYYGRNVSVHPHLSTMMRNTFRALTQVSRQQQLGGLPGAIYNERGEYYIPNSQLAESPASAAPYATVMSLLMVQNAEDTRIAESWIAAHMRYFTPAELTRNGIPDVIFSRKYGHTEYTADNNGLIAATGLRQSLQKMPESFFSPEQQRLLERLMQQKETQLTEQLLATGYNAEFDTPVPLLPPNTTVTFPAELPPSPTRLPLRFLPDAPVNSSIRYTLSSEKLMLQETAGAGTPQWIEAPIEPLALPPAGELIFIFDWQVRTPQPQAITLELQFKHTIVATSGAISLELLLPAGATSGTYRVPLTVFSTIARFVPAALLHITVQTSGPADITLHNLKIIPAETTGALTPDAPATTQSPFTPPLPVDSAI